MPDAAYYRAWRAAHPEYRDRQKRLRAERRRLHGRGDRTAEYARTAAKRASRATTPDVPLAPLFPELRHGQRVAFWDEELNMDVRQERSLAALEGRDPDEAERQLRARETSWWHHAVPFDLDG